MRNGPRLSAYFRPSGIAPPGMDVTGLLLKSPCASGHFCRETVQWPQVIRVQRHCCGSRDSTGPNGCHLKDSNISISGTRTGTKPTDLKFVEYSIVCFHEVPN